MIKMINLEINDNNYENINLIIFDKDGTMFQLYPYCSKMVFERTNAICNVLNDHDKELEKWLISTMGVDLENQKIYQKGPIGVYSKYYAQNMLFEKINEKGYDISREMLKKAFETADININQIDYLKDALIPVPGMMDFIKSSAKNCKLAIYSNDMTLRLNDTVELFNINNYFECVLGSDMITKHKPDPMGVLKIMEKLEIEPENTAFVGDSNLDIECGKRAGCKYLISILSDISDQKYLKQNSNEILNDFTRINVV
jgi:HAD superfamily hydrolase (TIGR01549 family)